jgi:hypothetical protein
MPAGKRRECPEALDTVLRAATSPQLCEHVLCRDQHSRPGFHLCPAAAKLDVPRFFHGWRLIPAGIGILKLDV